MGDDGIGALILAAGNSSRLGRPKQLLEFGGQTLIARAIAAASEAGCDPIVVVTGAVNLAAESRHERLIIAQNNDWQRGLGTSIRAGLRVIRDANPAALIILVCDQPHLEAGVIRRLIDRFRETGKPIVACAYRRTLGVPALFARQIFSELENLPDCSGAKQTINAAPARVASIDFPNGAIDIDTVEDLLLLRARD